MPSTGETRNAIIQSIGHERFIPQNGPVEFHWYAAEEAGLLGSLAMAGYKKDQGAKVGARMEFVSGSHVNRGVDLSNFGCTRV